MANDKGQDRRHGAVDETRAECVYVSEYENENRTRYLGAKRCPLGGNNTRRWQCKAYRHCIDAFILKRLEQRYLPKRILPELRNAVNGNGDSEYGACDFILLQWIGQVASESGYQFGRKAVNAAIRASNMAEDAEYSHECAVIRSTFGVFGRSGSNRGVKRPCGAHGGSE